MKHVICASKLVVLLVALMMLPLSWGYAAPEVPVKYPGDTDESIARRAQWIEGAKKEGKLVYWGILPPDQARTYIAAFNKIYPFIKVEYWRGSGEESGTKLEAEALTGRFTADVDLGSIQLTRFPVWRKNGWLDKWTQYIPEARTIGPGVNSKYDDWARPGANVITPQYNTRAVSASDAPKSWEDLLDPKWKGQIGIAVSTGAWEVLATGDGGWGIEKTLDYLRKLGQQKLVWLQGGYLGGHGLLVAGEVKIMVNALLPHLINARKKGAPVDWVKASPAIVSGPQYAMMKPINNPNAAYLFLEWAFSPDALELYEKVGGKGAVYPGAKTNLAKMVGNLPVIHQTEESTQKVIDLGLTKKFKQALGAP